MFVREPVASMLIWMFTTLDAVHQLQKLCIDAIVGFFIFVSTYILERVFSHLEGMCSDCK